MPKLGLPQPLKLPVVTACEKAPLEGHTGGRAAQSTSAAQCSPAAAAQPLLLLCAALLGPK